MDIITSTTLLERVKKNDDHQAWCRFYDLYSRAILGFAIQRGCDQVTAEDVLQDTMCQLVQFMPKFRYNPEKGRFTTYLCHVVLSVIRKHVSHKITTIPLNTNYHCTPSKPFVWYSQSYFDEFEKKRKETLLRHAFARVKEKIEPITWKSFIYFVINGDKSAEEVAEELGLRNRNSVYQHKDRIIKLLQKEVRTLENEIGDGDYTEDFNENDYHEKNLRTLLSHNETIDQTLKKRFKLLQTVFCYHSPEEFVGDQLLVMTSGNNRWIRLKGKFSIGTGPDNQLQLKSRYISKHHCLISRKNGCQMIKDLDSTNGVSINGRKISEHILHDGDIIQLGDITLIFSQPKNILDGSNSTFSFLEGFGG